jgi:hypothetical protein
MVTGIRLPYFSPGWNGWTGALRRQGANASTDLAAVLASHEVSAEINITTDDGDTVTISLESEADAGYAFYSRPASGGEGGLKASALVASVSRDLEVSVQGELDDEELADISSLLKRIELVIRNFLKGNFAAAAQQALGGADLDSLSSYSLDVEHTDTLTLLRKTEGAPQDSTGTGVIDKPMAQPLPVYTPGDETAPSTLPRPALEGPLGPPRPEVSEVLSHIGRTARDSGIDLARLGKLLTRLFQRLLHEIGREPGMELAQPVLDELSARAPEHLETTE